LPKIVTVPTLYCVNIDLKLELPINALRYLDPSKVRGEGISVIFLNRKILPGPEDARICFLFLTTAILGIQRSILLIMII